MASQRKALDGNPPENSGTVSKNLKTVHLGWSIKVWIRSSSDLFQLQDNSVGMCKHHRTPPIAPMVSYFCTVILPM